VKVRRDHLVEDAYQELHTAESKLKGQIKVRTKLYVVCSFYVLVSVLILVVLRAGYLVLQKLVLQKHSLDSFYLTFNSLFVITLLL